MKRKFLGYLSFCLICLLLITSCTKKEKIYTIGICEFVDSPTDKECELGFIQAFIDEEIIQDKDVKFIILNAHGDFPTANSIAHNFISKKVDLICSIDTPCLQACMNATSTIPVVFTSIANPILAGAGESYTDHLPNVTGVSVASPIKQTISLIKQMLPETKVIGTVWVPSELNSEFYMKIQKEEAEKVGLTTIAIPINATSEMHDAAMILVSKKIDVFYQISDNLTNLAFEAEVKVANEAQIPIFCNQFSEVKRGAAIGLGWDFYDAGYEAGKLAIRIMREDKPQDIPFQSMKESKLTINLEAAEIQGLNITEDILEKAAEVIE